MDDHIPQDLIDNAFTRFQNKEFGKAIDLLFPFKEQLQSNFDFCKLIAFSYYKLEAYKEAIPYLKKAAECKPSGEMISTCLYLCLVETDNFDDALEELFRFMNNFIPKSTYLTVLEELYEEKDGNEISDEIQKQIDNWHLKYNGSPDKFAKRYGGN